MFGIEQAFAATEKEVVATGVIAGFTMFIYVIALALIILLVVARWKIFTKAGEAGWKSIIPIYSDYVQWRIGWKKTGLFWAYIALVIGGALLMGASGAYVAGRGGAVVATGGGNQILGMIGAVLVLVGCILALVSGYKLICSFGHGAGWFVLYLLFPTIMLLVLAFGSSRHIGPQD